VQERRRLNWSWGMVKTDEEEGGWTYKTLAGGVRNNGAKNTRPMQDPEYKDPETPSLKSRFRTLAK
jgi:hypothetical protein